MERFNVAIVGGGPGCLAIMDMISADRLRQLRMKLIGLADINPEAPGMKRAQALGIFVSTDYHDLFELPDLNLILELTGREEISKSVQEEKPPGVRLIDHSVARLFWDILQLEEEKREAEREAEKKRLKAVGTLIKDIMQLEEEKLSAEKEAEERLRAERDRTAGILNGLTEAVIVLNRDHVIEDANETFLKEFGGGREKVIGKKCSEIRFNQEESCEDVLCPTVDHTLSTLSTSRREHAFRRDGEGVYWEAVYNPLRDEQGEYTRCLISMADLTHRKKLEMNLEKSQKKYKNLFEAAHDGIALFNGEGQILEGNLSLSRMLGYPHDAIAQMKISELAKNASKKILSDHLTDLESMGFVSVEMEFTKKSGSSLPVEASITWEPEEKMFQMMARDISVRKRLEASRKLYSEKLEQEVEKRTQELRASQEEALRQKNYAEGIINGSPIPMFVLNGDHKITYWNTAVEDLTGCVGEEMIGTDKHWKPFFPEKRPLLADLVIEGDMDSIHRLYEGMKLRKSPVIEGAFEAEHYFPHLGKDGTHLYFNAAPIKDDSGNIQGAIVTYQDFSERVRMAEKLRASQQEALRQKKYAEGIIYGSPIPMFVLDKNHKITYWNKACEELTRHSSEKMIGTDQQWKPFYREKRPLLADLIMEGDIDTTHKLYDEMKLRQSATVQGAYEAESFLPRVGEEGRHLYFTAAPITDETGAVQGAIETFIDFSERVKMTREIRRREAFVQNLIENSIDGILATDFEGKLVIFNKAIADILGYSPDEIIGKMRYPQILSRETTKNIRKAFYSEAYGPEGKIINMQVEVLNKQGEPIPVRISGTLLFQKKEEMGSVVFMQDLREILRLQKEKEQAERMAAIGQTVAGLAHYIKNILNGLKGGAYVINSAMRKNDMELIGNGWRMVEKNIDQITHIVMDMLVYSKERKPQYQPVDPNELVIDVLELMKERAEVSGVSIMHDLDPGLGKVFMERTGIHRCLLNLVSNAIDACTLEGIMEGRGVVTVKTEKPEGWAVRFQVMDNGTGMTQETKEKLFTGFFSTKGYKGTGLGLPVTQKIVTEHNGELSFESQEGNGTTFNLLLPEKS